MKNLLVITALLLSNFAFLQAQNDFFDKYRDDERFTVVDVKAQLLQMLENVDIEGNEEAKMAMEIAQDIKAIQILNTQETPEAFYKEAEKSIALENYASMLTVRTQDGDNVNIMSKGDSDSIVKDLLILVGGDEFVLIRIDGSIDLSRLGELSKLSSLGGGSAKESTEGKSDDKQQP